MLNTTVSETGQITIPQEIMDYLKLSSGSQISFAIDEKGQVKIVPLKFSVEELAGILHRPGIRKVTIEEMEMAISEGANDRS